MARSIADIKNEIAREFMRNETAAEKYGFKAGGVFSDYFSAASVENILFYVWAVCAWAVEQLVCRHKEEVTAELDELVAHRPKWYRDKVLGFMADTELPEDSDTYDTAGLNDSEVEARHMVKHAVATESGDASVLTIKVAGESNGKRGVLEAEYERQLKAYIGEIKDAGVRIALVNMAADTFNCAVDVYYNPLLEASSVKASCETAIKDYIENLPFNGEYTNMALVDCLQSVDGVKVVELLKSSSRAANEIIDSAIDARATPAAGYFKPGNITVNMKAYE